MKNITPQEHVIKALQSVLREKADANAHTVANYASAISKLSKYLAHIGKYDCTTLADITSGWVELYAQWLKSQHPCKLQTADFYLRTTSSLFHHTIKRNACFTHNPFSGKSISHHKPSKRALMQAEVSRLCSPQLRCRLKPLYHPALDILLFSLYARGMVFHDIFNLQWNMVSNGHIRYLRNKTHVPIDVEVSPEIAAIMERYRNNGSPYIFPFLHTSHRNGDNLSEKSALRRINRLAKHIGEAAHLSLPLSTYVMRHTWATLMLESGKSVEVIKQCLGHTSIRTTQIYLSNISTARIDSEVNDMMNRVFRQSVHKPSPDTIRNMHKLKPLHIKFFKKISVLFHSLPTFLITTITLFFTKHTT